ncbi:putative protein TPRXL [Penaeus monodon]|uniref:putative protein TPRXL n=1 Tax=Penaeus monodon TaxID=6687 RepID=UPI0018A7938A|nr:putative protein TPRXL [Penaeus monodon]
MPSVHNALPKFQQGRLTFPAILPSYPVPLSYNQPDPILQSCPSSSPSPNILCPPRRNLQILNYSKLSSDPSPVNPIPAVLQSSSYREEGSLPHSPRSSSTSSSSRTLSSSPASSSPRLRLDDHPRPPQTSSSSLTLSSSTSSSTTSSLIPSSSTSSSTRSPS